MVQLTTEEFTWSTTEQPYPFRLGTNGEILYAKKLNLGALPDTGTLSVAHELQDASKIFKLSGTGTNGEVDQITLPYVEYYSVDEIQTNIGLYSDITNVVVTSYSGNYNSYSGTAYLVYSK